jgi:Icc-related predicted phosphoesterase
MRVLVVVDIHKNPGALQTTLRYIEDYKAELLIIAGDITTFGPLKFAIEFLKEVSKITTLALPGNCDPREILSIMDGSSAINLHGRKEVIGDITFVGLGGSNSTPFNTPFELTEDEIYNSLENLMEPGAILVLHFPVKGHLDLVGRGEHTGSTGALKIVEKFQPSIVISGHIHETRGIETDEHGILYVNPGPMKDGFAAVIDIEKQLDKVGYKCVVQLIP